MDKFAILCVDDEEIILNSLEMQLSEHFGEDYTYEFAENAQDAFEVLEEFVEQDIGVVLIVSDWLMLGMKGDEFLIKATKKYPGLATIMLSGQVDEKALERAKKEAGLSRFIPKPWDKKDLIDAITSAVQDI